VWFVPITDFRHNSPNSATTAAAEALLVADNKVAAAAPAAVSVAAASSRGTDGAAWSVRNSGTLLGF